MCHIDRLKMLRKISGLTQNQLANALDVTKSAIGMWENKKREPDLTMLAKIADYFKTSVDFLLGRTDDPLIHLSQEEAAMLEEYRRLNAEGQNRVSQYIEDLVAGGRFTATSESSNHVQKSSNI